MSSMSSPRVSSLSWSSGSGAKTLSKMGINCCVMAKTVWLETWSRDCCQGKQKRCSTKGSRLTEFDKHLVHGFVLLVVLGKRKNSGKGRQHISKRNTVGASHDHAGNAACSVVEKPWVVIGVAVQEALELLQNVIVLAQDGLPIPRVVAQKTKSICRIRLGVLILV